MEQKHENGDNLTNLADVLQDLAPTPARLDTAQTLFLAGQQSIRRHQRWQILWPLSSACLAVTCITLGVLLARPTQPRIVYVPIERSTSVVDSVVDKDAASRPQAEVIPRQRSTPRQTRVATVSPTATQWHDFEEIRRWQAQVLNGALDHAGTEPTAGEPAIIKPVRSSDWRSLLTDAHLAEGSPHMTTPSPFDWTALFSTKGS